MPPPRGGDPRRRGGPARPWCRWFGLLWSLTSDADYYDIFRSTNGRALAWVGRSYGEGYADGSAVQGTTVRYVVRARNDNGYADSSQTVALSVRPPEEWQISSFRRLTTGGGQIELSFPSETGVTYGAERSTSLGSGGWSDIGGAVSGNGAREIRLHGLAQ
jgi:hypothetical protein